MAARDILTQPIGYGEEITLCSDHLLETCHRCGMCFEMMNDDARGRRRAKKFLKKPMKKGLLPKGTEISFRHENGSCVIFTIKGWMMGDPDLGPGSYGSLPCYIIQVKDAPNTDFSLIEISEAHEEWFLHGVTLEQARKFIKNGVPKAFVEGEAEDYDSTSDDEGEDEENRTAQRQAVN